MLVEHAGQIRSAQAMGFCYSILRALRGKDPLILKTGSMADKTTARGEAC